MASLKWLAGALLACVVCASPLSAYAAGLHGGIFVTSLPAGAAVWMDGTYLGETPLFVDSVESGRHAVTLIHSGWQPQTVYADVSAGHVTPVSIVLAQNSGARPPASRAKGMLSVRTPAGSKVSLDGTPLLESNEAQSVDAGDHILSISKPGSARITQIVHIYPQITTVIDEIATSSAAVSPTSDDDVLAMLEQYVPPSNYTMNGDVITIHYHGVEVECAIGSKNYMLNGKSGTLSLAPALVAKKAYLPLSLLKRITGISKTVAR